MIIFPCHNLNWSVKQDMTGVDFSSRLLKHTSWPVTKIVYLPLRQPCNRHVEKSITRSITTNKTKTLVRLVTQTLVDADRILWNLPVITNLPWCRYLKATSISNEIEILLLTEFLFHFKSALRLDNDIWTYACFIRENALHIMSRELPTSWS